MRAKLRVLVTDPLHADALSALAADEALELLDRSGVDEAEWRAELPRVEAWIIRSGTKVRAEHLAEAPLLKVIGRAGVGVDNVDVAAATAGGVLVMNAPDANSTTTAELAIAHLLALARNLVRGDRMVREGRWERKQLVGTEVEGKTLGVIGLGRIGRKVAEKGRGLGMRVIAHDPYVAAAALEGSGIEGSELEALLAEADFVSLHLPMTEATRGLLSAERIAGMKAGARLVNCARGGLIDEEALVAALESGRLAGAALDVFATEPPPADHPLLGCETLTATPHLGASTREASRKVSLAILSQVRDYLLGLGIRNAVNLPSLSAETMRRLEPWTVLAERCGRLLAQLGDWPVTEVRIEARGEVDDDGSSLLTSSFLAGLLSSQLDQPVNVVSARQVAADRGIQVEEVRSAQPRDFSGLLSFEVEGASGRRRVGGALFGRRMPRVVLLDDARLEVVPEGSLLVLRNHDRPGVIGRIGTLLGASGINISSMAVTRPAEDGLCWAVLSVEAPVPAALAEEVAGIEGIESVRRVELS